ncbi:MAG: response regulator [Mucilaginibacter sp.]|nr:response regulator [Mucilaginibacter sp.]MDB5015895.1 response regulator [Mucilaginibacter sp.]
MNKKFSFIIIDDSELDCFVTQKFLERSNENGTIKAFQNAKHALEMIRENPIEDNCPTIIFLDLQMPFMNGFDFIEEFEKFAAEIQKNYKIAILTILSPANNPTDVSKILTYKAVNSIIEKPLTKEKLLSFLIQV